MAPFSMFSRPGVPDDVECAAAWIFSDDRVQRARDLIRVTLFSNLAEVEDVWSLPNPRPIEELIRENADADPLEVAQGANRAVDVSVSDRGGEGLFISHIWDPPTDWAQYFEERPYAELKALQVESAVTRSAVPDGDPAQVKLWIDRLCVPPPVSKSDHAMEKAEFGPYIIQVGDAKALVEGGEGEFYSVIRLNEERSFEGTMRVRELDLFGKMKPNPVPVDVRWKMSPGWYFVRSARLVRQEAISDERADTAPNFSMFGGTHLRKWCQQLKLLDDLWIEVSLGSVKSECQLLTETIMSLHPTFVAVMPWNYFDDLWAMFEWAIFCLCKGVLQVQLAVDVFSHGSLVDYHRALRRVSVNDAICHDERDRRLIYQKIQCIFSCETVKTTHYVLPMGEVKTGPVDFDIKSKINFSAFERYIRATAIAVWAREAAMTTARSADETVSEQWFLCWAGVAEEYSIFGLRDALRMFRPHKWFRDQYDLYDDPEIHYNQAVEDWFEQYVLPEISAESKLACREAPLQNGGGDGGVTVTL